jgi:peptide deformylase
MAETIRTFGDRALRREAAAVERIDEETKKICERMVEAMIRADGLAIAAPQIGVSKRIVVLDLDGVFHVLVNPEIVERSEDLEERSEGCLSVPGAFGPVARATKVRVRGTDLNGETMEIESEGLLARAIQHEIDHLDGVLFLDHLSPARRQSLLREYARGRKKESE